MSRLDNQIFKSTIDKVKIFFYQQKWKEIFIFLFFVLLSSGLWYQQSLQQEYEIEIEIPIKYKNMPNHIFLTENNPEVIVAKVRDKGTVLLNYSWLRTFAPVEVNMKDVKPETSPSVTVSKRVVEAMISKQLIASTSLLSFEPQTIQVEYAKLSSKELPVQLQMSLSMKPGFQLADSIQIIPDKVLAHASSIMLDSLYTLKTVHREIKDADKTREITFQLQKIEGVRMQPNEIKVIIPIEEFTEKRFTLPILCPDVPDNYTLRAFPSSFEVICNIPISRFKDLTESDFEIQIPFQEFEENQNDGELSLRLTKKPGWISEPVLNPNTTEFIIEQKKE